MSNEVTESIRCRYKDCQDTNSHFYIYGLGPFKIFVQFCQKHKEEFDNFIKVIQAKNVSWNPNYD